MGANYAKPSVVLGTAGHIDHGKSALVQALTGTNPDRLAEEQRRGITIELGFARLELPDGTSVGVVDVPGHEKFVRQMIAGATGIDAALLVIAADDGIMPQTREHLAVLQLLQVPTCVVALTKTDLVDEEWVEFVRDEVAGLLATTPYAGAAIVPCSSRTGAGLDELKGALQEALKGAARSHADGRLRMPADRAFVVKGVGIVVTGTLWSGTARPGDAVRLEPSGLDARVRTVQVHGADVESAGAGHRVALNLTGVEAGDVHAGDFVVDPSLSPASDRFDCALAYLDPEHSGKPLKTGVRVRVAHGTREVFGRVLLMDGQELLKPGESAWAQIRLDEPLAVARDDRFVVRSYSPVRVIGGGRVLEARPRRRSMLHDADRAVLAAIESGDLTGALQQFAAEPGAFRTAREGAQVVGLLEDEAAALLDQLAAKGTLQAVVSSRTRFYCTRASLQKAAGALENTLLKFHAANPNEPGMQKAALRHAALPSLDEACFEGVLAHAAHAGALVVEDGVVSHAKAGAGAKRQAEARANAALQLLEQAGATPPFVADVQKALGCSQGEASAALGVLEKRGDAVRIDRDLYYSAPAFEQLKSSVVACLQAHGEANAATLKDAMGVSRKYAIPVLEKLDALGVTKRAGDMRTL